MIALDYFLYDNWTLSERGTDWNVKAATGVLASRDDLQASFQTYCKLTRGHETSLRGFDFAIGGFPAGRGYLLCVTLESLDTDGRPSWAVVGFWCSDR